MCGHTLLSGHGTTSDGKNSAKKEKKEERGRKGSTKGVKSILDLLLI